MKRLLTFVQHGANLYTLAQLAIALAAAIGAKEFVKKRTASVDSWTEPYAVALMLVVFAASLLATQLVRSRSGLGVANPAVTFIPPRPGVEVGRYQLLSHARHVLQPELTLLHTLFTLARDSDGSDLDGIEQAYKLRVETIVSKELVEYTDLYNEFYDDTGFNQPARPTRTRQTDMADFLERRYLRLKRIMDEIKKRQGESL